jgi:hypothetical protein
MQGKWSRMWSRCCNVRTEWETQSVILSCTMDLVSVSHQRTVSYMIRPVGRLDTAVTSPSTKTLLHHSDQCTIHIVGYSDPCTTHIVGYTYPMYDTHRIHQRKQSYIRIHQQVFHQRKISYMSNRLWISVSMFTNISCSCSVNIGKPSTGKHNGIQKPSKSLPV